MEIEKGGGGMFKGGEGALEKKKKGGIRAIF